MLNQSDIDARRFVLEHNTCTKMRFPSREVATKERIKVNNKRGKKAAKLTGVYFCKKCRCFHTTSMSKQRIIHYRTKNGENKTLMK